MACSDNSGMDKAFGLDEAMAEAQKCLLCHEPPCSRSCPAHIDPGTFIRKLRLKNLTGAVSTVQENSLRGGNCSALCPSARLCEKECSAGRQDRPIRIGKLHRFLTEKAGQPGFRRPGVSPAQKPDLSVEFCGKKLLNPFMVGSSPAANSARLIERAFEAGWGSAACKTVATDRVRFTHPSPRMHPYNYGAQKLAGLQNVEQTSDRGLKPNMLDITYLKKRWPRHIVMASIMGFSDQDWAELAAACTDAGADMIELNFSCPHMSVEGAGCKVGQADALVEKFTATVRKATKLPLIAKMTPNIADMNEPALAAKRGGADAISAINTVRAISEIGLDDHIPRPNVFGKGAISGYSGPAVKPIGLRFIAELAANKKLGLPLSGMGGIETWTDSLEYLLAGAATVQVTTGILHYGYRVVEDMIEGLSDYMSARGIMRVSDLIGKALPNLHETGGFDVCRQGSASYDLDRCVGCGQCYRVCRDAGGEALEWDSAKRRPVLTGDKCLSCMICSFLCPVSGLITFKEMPAGWRRREAVTPGN